MNIDRANSELLEERKNEMTVVCKDNVNKVPVICQILVAMWNSIGKKGWKYIDTLKLRKVMIDMIFEFLWLVKENSIFNANIKGFDRVWIEDEGLLFMWYKWKKGKANDEGMLEKYQKYEELLVRTKFINGSLIENFVKLIKIQTLTMKLEQMQLIFGWKFKERFILEGEEILDSREVVKIEEKRKVGTGFNRNRLPVRIKKKKKLKSLKQVEMKRCSFNEIKISEELY
jgi:hypothetical protein